MRRRPVFPLLIGVCAALPLACLLTLALQWPTQRAVYESVQPRTISYQSFDPYTLVVLEGGRVWTTIPWGRRYQLFVGKAGDAQATYGHYLDYSFHPTDADITTHIQQSQVRWDADGVRFVEASGHEVFIPKAMFTGGR